MIQEDSGQFYGISAHGLFSLASGGHFDQKMSQRYFYPAEYTIKTNLKLTLSQKKTPKFWLSVYSRWAKMSLAHFSARTRCLVPSLLIKQEKQRSHSLLGYCCRLVQHRSKAKFLLPTPVRGRTVRRIWQLISRSTYFLCKGEEFIWRFFHTSQSVSCLFCLSLLVMFECYLVLGTNWALWRHLTTTTRMHFAVRVTHERFFTKEKRTEYNSLPQSILGVEVKWRHHANLLLMEKPMPPIMQCKLTGEIVGCLEFFIFYLSHLLTSIIGSCFLLAFYLVLVLFYYCVGNGEKLQLECQPLAKHPDQTWVSQ